MADPHRRYDATQDEFPNSRGRSPPGWRPRSPQRWSSSSPVRHRRSPSPNAGQYPSQSPARWRSPARYRNRSRSPAPRRKLSPRRSRSRSPPSNYTIEDPQHRRRRLLAQKVMSLETYHRLLLDPHSPWSKTAKRTSMPIPVPLESNENVADYQQKFEFWLAQRNVTLESLRQDVIRERGYRCNYAQWRVQTGFGQPPPKVASAYGPKALRSRSTSWSQNGRGRETERYPHSPARTSARQATEETQGYAMKSLAVSTAPASRFYDVRRRTADCCCNTCDRNWADLYKRVQQLERIVARLDLAPPGTFNGTSSSPYEIGGGEELYQDEHAVTSNYIDLTDDIEMTEDTDEVLLHHEHVTLDDGETCDNTVPSRSVEVTPTDSDVNNDSASATVNPQAQSDAPKEELELKHPRAQTHLLDAYNRLNVQVLLKQKEEEAMVARMELIIDDDESSAVDLKSQIDELRSSIKTEKHQRDTAVAAVIVDSRADNREELARELEKVAALSAPSELEDLHAKCAGIASKLAEKDNEVARLQKQLQSLSSLHVGTEESGSSLGEREAQGLSSKIKLERASKASLETECHKIFTRLMKSSHQIQALVTKELSSNA